MDIEEIKEKLMAIETHTYDSLGDEYRKALINAVKLINKQQKEIENYKNLIEDVSQIAKELKLEEDGTIDEIFVKIKQQQEEIAELSEKLTEKICKGVEEEILEEYRQTIISKDKEIEELKKDNEHQWEQRCKMAIELDNNVVSKDKIKEIVNRYATKEIEYGIDFYREIKELLEE